MWPPFGVRQSGRCLQLSGRSDGRGEITEGVLEPPRRRNPALQLAVSACLLVLWSAGAWGWVGVWKEGFLGQTEGSERLTALAVVETTSA